MPKVKKRKAKHHFVPIWYQKRFLPEGTTGFCRLAITPKKIRLGNRQTQTVPSVSYNRGPSVCFYERDLYSVRLFGQSADFLERYLFGEVDRVGALGIDGVVCNDFSLLHKYLAHFLRYMDAQKLRTPKGLAWIQSIFDSASKNELLAQFTAIRQIHCTLWAEAVKEIVSAETSSIKFIVSDNPVTIYNQNCFPGSPECRYPFWPSMSWIGSQVIFPLDLNRCLILSHLDYAKGVGKSKLKKDRPNTRAFDTTVFRIDNIIRGRKLDESEVAAINYILKIRALKNVCAGNEEWLYPEKNLKGARNWAKLHRVLLPPKDELWRYGGELFVGGENGRLKYYQGTYGEKPTTKEEWKDKQKQVDRMREVMQKALKKDKDKIVEHLRKSRK